MKINGKKIAGANYEYIVIPRPGGEDIVFKAQAVLDMQPFHDLCPRPKPGKLLLPGGATKDDFDDAAYKQSVTTYGERRYAFMVLKSLEGSPGLEWETVKMTDPSTWLNWEIEIKEAGFSVQEVTAIQTGIATANALNQDKLDEARMRFLLSLPAEQPAS